MATLKAIGYEALFLNLDSVTPKTWLKRAVTIQSLQGSERLGATIIYLHTTLLLRASRKEYRPAFDAILRSAKQQKLVIFVFQDNLDGIFAMRDRDTREPMTAEQLWEALRESNKPTHPAVLKQFGAYPWSDAELLSRDSWLANAIERLRDYQARKPEVDSLIRELYESGAQVAPFFVRSDVTIRLQEFLDDLEQGIFLRLFVPDDRLQADQLKSFLTVLERYLRQVEREDFSIESRKSDKGTNYVFKWNAEAGSLDNLNQVFARFDDFMKLCDDNPSQAESILRTRGFNEQDASLYVSRYTKDYRRIILDSRHEFERKLLSLKQRFESEGVDAGALPALPSTGGNLSGLLSLAATGGHVEINIGSVALTQTQRVKTEVDQIVNGSVRYGVDDNTLMELFSRYADRLEAIQCRSDLDQLKDQTAPEPARQNAKQRLSGFLRKAAQRAGEAAESVGVAALTKYLESLLKGS